jgi:hypothetical protein
LAADGFSDYGSSNEEKVPEYQTLQQTQKRIADSASNLIK